MKKYLVFAFIIFMFCIFLTACGKDPLAPSTPLALTVVPWTNGSPEPVSSGTITIKAGADPIISWTYSGVSSGVGKSLAIGVFKGSPATTANPPVADVRWVVYVPQDTTSVTYGIAPTGSTIVVAKISLAPGTYNVGVILKGSSSPAEGAGIGIIVVE